MAPETLGYQKSCEARRFRPAPQRPWSLIGIRTFGLVLEHLAGARIDADFERLACILDIERITQTGATTFFLELLVGDDARVRAERGVPGLRQRHFRHRQQFGARKMLWGRGRRGRRSEERDGGETGNLTHISLLGFNGWWRGVSTPGFT